MGVQRVRVGAVVEESGYTEGTSSAYYRLPDKVWREDSRTTPRRLPQCGAISVHTNSVWLDFLEQLFLSLNDTKTQTAFSVGEMKAGKMSGDKMGLCRWYTSRKS